MSTIRPVISVTKSRPTMEGAGVRLHRAFGKVDDRLDPFLLLDDFGSEDPEDYLEGFPWHPHRGIETITYMLSGEVRHGDSLGNSGTIGAGEVQWMTAGGGIIHEEMPLDSGKLRGFQLWSNLPRAHKMMRPRYRDVKAAEIPLAALGQGASAKVISGSIYGVSGPVQDVVTDPRYLDITLEPGVALEIPLDAGHNGFAYLYQGSAGFGEGAGEARLRSLVVFGDGDAISVAAGAEGACFLLVSGKPIGEPVAWGGPIVMNTQAELSQAFSEYRDGTFLDG